MQKSERLGLKGFTLKEASDRAKEGVGFVDYLLILLLNLKLISERTNGKIRVSDLLKFTKRHIYRG